MSGYAEPVVEDLLPPLAGRDVPVEEHPDTGRGKYFDEIDDYWAILVRERVVADRDLGSVQSG
ncbi:hypothetical protein ACFWIW_24460 [Amycolatopsis sp. NPDC058340]|uniref:hypothetical protein n=1 Tax=Amycolatopsis sp. NPDC058340 TaxID=3346453 RepID=UPI0036587297